MGWAHLESLVFKRLKPIVFLLALLSTMRTGSADEHFLGLFSEIENQLQSLTPPIPSHCANQPIKKKQSENILGADTESNYPSIVTEIYHGTQKVSVLSEEEFSKIYKEIAANRSLAFEYHSTGCDQRSYRISEILSKRGIDCVQILFHTEGTGKISFNGSEAGLWHDTPYWWHYHVAPAVYVQANSNSQPVLRVIDPVLFPKMGPSSSEWTSALRRQLKNNDPYSLKPYLSALLSKYDYVEDFMTSDSYPTQFQEVTHNKVEKNLEYLQNNLELMKAYRK